MVLTPDLTIFLDVSPELACQRKPDHDVADIWETNKGLRDFLAGKKGIVFVNANREFEEVINDVYRAIEKLFCQHGKKG
jgi:thymidylate kinase